MGPVQIIPPFQQTFQVFVFILYHYWLNKLAWFSLELISSWSSMNVYDMYFKIIDISFEVTWHGSGSSSPPFSFKILGHHFFPSHCKILLMSFIWLLIWYHKHFYISCLRSSLFTDSVYGNIVESWLVPSSLSRHLNINWLRTCVQ